mmetsp:Transcript_49015/g.127955  ORF Transcript_49015/g.127955 Transcript_49015/m.127955 type:complete len:255 (+) Transcript_49015:81-845(+)|eukprot:CAMPEP_0115863138 /NCGR_PEP_ID=MMETSP0287-20121206/18539_1 /TAXON_ID=412157 /ORGANISM="Chrysochromulina rotalis, Strain UIO044" /LENGTH=254 /DNA_ID=CAMNT_0003317585 /DNA_START=74 /DNA_END=838 /DNA_ORIENTATION=+
MASRDEELPVSKTWPSTYKSEDERHGLPRVRELVGAGPSDKELMVLLDKSGHCVRLAAKMFWGDRVISDDGQKSDDASGSSGVLEFASSVQVRFDCAFTGHPIPVSKLNALAIELADAGETGGLIQIWDKMKGSKCASPALWAAVERLHARGKGKIPSGMLRLSEFGELQKMAPARRLHKICKGRRMSARAVDSEQTLPRGLMWVEAQKAAGISLDASGGKRMKIAKQLKKALGIDLETARGLVTKLKRKKVLS